MSQLNHNQITNVVGLRRLKKLRILCLNVNKLAGDAPDGIDELEDLIKLDVSS